MASERDELRRKLQEQQLELASRVVSPRQAVVALLLGQPTSLEHFQSLEQKLALLDTAVAMHAGSALTKIVVFLSRTLSSHVLHRHLASRSQAAKVRSGNWDFGTMFDKSFTLRNSTSTSTCCYGENTKRSFRPQWGLACMRCVCG